MSFTPRIIDTSSTELGKVIRINITDDGIFRVFYNDTAGNMYCALSRESNYKQVIFKSAQNRTTIDVSNIELNGFNDAIYGGTYNMNEISNSSISPPINVTGPFYVFQYSVNSPSSFSTSTDRGPWRYFTELKFENFISQGSTANNPSIYDKNGYSSILANGQNQAFDTGRTPHFYNQVAQGWGVTATPGIDAALINIGTPIPDTLNLYGQTVTDVITNNRQLNDDLFNGLQLFEPTWRNTSIDTNYMSLPGNTATNKLGENNYYAAYASSKFVWLDAGNNATSNTNGDIGNTDNYYKGRWLIWVDISGSSSTSGDIYIARTNNSYTFPFFYNIIDNFNDSSTPSNVDISSIHVDIDVDISKNSTINSGNFNNIYAKPFFVASSDLSNNIVVGNAPYDVTGANVNDINYIQIPVLNNSVGAKYCKIKVDHTSNDWDTTKWHLVYYDIDANKPVYARGENNTFIDTSNHHYYLQDLNWMSDNPLPSFPCGLFLDMAIDSLGLPHVVFYSRQRQPGPQFSSGITYLKAINNPPTSTNDWEASFVDDTMAINEPGYTDLSNNHPISIKLDKDDKAHIVYQAQNSSGDFDIRYWTNSTKLSDISEIDSSLNYVGFRTEGANIDDISGNIEVYWDISACNCIFSRDYNRKDISGIITSKKKVKEFYYPLGARPGNGAAWSPLVLSTQESWKDGLYYNHAALDKIYAVVDIVTPTSQFSNDLICLGGTANQGSIKFGISYDIVAGVNFVYMVADNGQSFLLTAKPSETKAILYKDGVLASGLPNTQFALQNGTAYRLKYYFNRSNYYGSIQVKRLNGSSPTDFSEGLYEFYDIIDGGFFIGDGYLSLLASNHNSSITPTSNPLYLSAVSIYATDKANVPTFDLSRNGGTLTEVTGTPFSSYSDFSGVELEPTVMKYQVVNAKNSLNLLGSTGGESKIKETVLHDIYYYERINTQNDQNQQNVSQNFVNVFDKFTTLVNGYYEIWAAGYYAFGFTSSSENYPKLWRSVDGGQNWTDIENYPTGVSGEQILDLKTYIDKNGGKWVFVCGDNYLIRVTNDYLGNQPGGIQLGTVWQTIGDAPSLGNGDPSGNYYTLLSEQLGLLNQVSLHFNCIKITEINNAQSTAIFNSAPAHTDDFHVWLGTDSYNMNFGLPSQPISVNNIRIVVEGGSFNYEKYWFLLRVIDASGNTTTVLSARDDGSTAQNATEYGGTDVGLAAPYDDYHSIVAGDYILRLYDTYGDGWHGANAIVYDLDGNTLTSGTISSGSGPVDLTFSISTDPLTLPSYPLGFPGYKDMLIRGNYQDYSNNQLDYSYNIVTNAILDSSNNPTKTFNEAFNTFSFGGEYQNNGNNNTEGLNYGIVTTDSYIYQTKDGGLNWDKRLGIDRYPMIPGYPRGTMGSYVDKNIKFSTGQYDNSGMYIQTSTEPWNDLPGFTVAYNDGDYDLSFTPIDSTKKKTTTWSPELGDYQDFWNINTIDSNDSVVKYRLGGGNNLKVYIDSTSSNGTDYQKKQKMYTYDSLITGNQAGNSNLYYDERSVLYLRDSELKNMWQRINPSIVDPSLNTYITSGIAMGLLWDSFSDYDCSYSIVNLPFASRSNNTLYNPIGNSTDLNNYAGFYKLSKTPFTPYIKVTQPQNNLFSANLTVQYRGGNSTGILNPTQYNLRLDFVKLNIKSYFYFRKKSGINSPYDNWTLTDGTATSSYTKSVIELEPGATFQFKVRLRNNYGFGWYSNESDEIVIPAPSPEINDLKISSKIFENVVSWKPYQEPVNNQNSLQTVFSYNIEKQYVDDTGVWATDISFTDFYKDLSGTLGPSYGSLNATKWTGPFNPVTGLKDLTAVSFCSFVDTDLSLNGIYRYIVTAFPSNVNTTSSNSFTISNQTSSGKPKYITHQYNPIDASFNILWTIDSDINSNTDVTWDVSWQEIRKDSPQYDNSGVVQITDPYIGQSGIGKTRQVTIPLLNNHLQADASYNYQIKVDYSNNTIITDYAPSSSNIQTPLYSGGEPYDPSGIKTYYNFQQPPVLNEANYNTTTDLLDINWTATNIPTTPFYYDVSMSNITPGRTQVVYNFVVYNGTSLVDPSNNGKNIYPGSYVVQVRAAYGDSVPVDISLFSEWSAPVTFTNDVPEHLPSNLKIIPYNFNNQPGNYTDVSYVKLTWDSPSNDDYSLTLFPIPQRYTLIRKTASKDYNYVIDFTNNDIPRTSNFYNDINYPLAHFNPTVPRIYRYDLSANYDPPPFILNYPLPTLQNNLGEVNYTLNQNFSTGTVQFIPMTGGTAGVADRGNDIGGGSGYEYGPLAASTINNITLNWAISSGSLAGNNILTNYTIALATSQLSIGQHTLVSRPIIPNVKYQLKITLDGTEYNYTDISFNGFGGYFSARMSPPLNQNGNATYWNKMEYYDGTGVLADMGSGGYTYGTKLLFQFTTWLPNGRAPGKTGTVRLNHSTNFPASCLAPWEFSVNGGAFQSFSSTGAVGFGMISGGVQGGRWYFAWPDASVPHVGHPFSVGDMVVIKYTKPSVDVAGAPGTSGTLAVDNAVSPGSIQFAQTQQTLPIEVVAG